MSGSGYFKYRCKNFFTYNCPHWVWVNNTPCAACVAAGRESLDQEFAERTFQPHEIIVPIVYHGQLVHKIVDSIEFSNMSGHFGMGNDSSTSPHPPWAGSHTQSPF